MDLYGWRLFRNDLTTEGAEGAEEEKREMNYGVQKPRFFGEYFVTARKYWVSTSLNHRRFKRFARLTRWNSLLAVELVDRP